MILAAIDIGSNAVRLLISEATTPEDLPVKLKLLRIPLRLGFEAFLNKRISEDKISDLIKTMKVYQIMMDIYNVEHYAACATSALRDAENSKSIVKAIKEETGIEVKLISGAREAAIIYDTHIAETLAPDRSYLYIDVGGGSTELTLFSGGKKITAKSFNIGTIRMLNDQVPYEAFTDLKDWLKKNTRQFDSLVAIGSGGNINTLHQLSRQPREAPLYLNFIEDMLQDMKKMTVEERMKNYQMKPDRADVVIPACKIFIRCMKWGRIKKIYVPQIGLSDGIVKELAERHLVASTPE